MFVERRGQVIRVTVTLVNWQQEEPTDRGEGRQLFMDDTSRVSRVAQARFCERLGVRFPGATRPVGHWEGDTLVVETTGFRDDVWLDVNGSPLTTTGKITERFRRPNYGSLQIDITIEDPKAYTKPFTVRVNQRIMVDTDLIEFVCNENEKSSQHYDK